MIFMKAKTALLSLTLLIMGVFPRLQVQAADKPNILVIFGDEIPMSERTPIPTVITFGGAMKSRQWGCWVWGQ